MKQIAFCEHCIKENEYKVYNENKISELNGENINFMNKTAICNKCGNEIFISGIWDYNLSSLYKEYRRKHNLISIEEINYILNKYSIDDKSLSLLLSWQSETVGRYLDGDMIQDSPSNILKEINRDPAYYLVILQSNKEKINPVSYNKTRQAVKKILDMKITEEKIDAVIKYILLRCEDFTQYGLQKLLYYVQAFCYVFTNNFIFEEECTADIEGPNFESVCERYEKFGYNEVNEYILNNENLNLEDFERNIVECIIKFYSCYSSKTLKKMTHNELPWVIARHGINNKSNLEKEKINPIMDKQLISDYFTDIKKKYDMINLFDIQKYSLDLFDNVEKEVIHEDYNKTY